MVNIAIDGPSGAGKSTLAKALAKELGFIHVDTGAMYRVVGLYIMRCGIDPKNTAAVAEKLSEIKMDIRYESDVQRMYLNGEDVTGLIRQNTVSAYASEVSSIGAVRTFLLDVQRDMAKTHNVIMDGRDIGTVILPDASVKFFMTASDKARALRRYAEIVSRGENISLEEVETTMSARDKNDSTRKLAPAIPASDAIMLDNSSEFKETLQKALDIIKDRIK